MGSRNKSQGQKRGPWSLGERKVKVTLLEWQGGEEREGKRTGVLLGGRVPVFFPLTGVGSWEELQSWHYDILRP